jgi:hypothetical protein
MSEAKDAVGKALVLNRRLAATKLVRKEELEAELARLRGGSDPDAAQIEALEGELAETEAALQAALAEIRELERMGRGIDAGVARAQVDAALNPDPVLKSPEEDALDRVREHIGGLDAEVRLADELAERPRARPATQDEADAEARAKFEELRAQRGLSDAPRPPSKKTL